MSATCSHLEPFLTTIGEAVSQIGQQASDFDVIAPIGECRFVVRLCEALATQIGRDEVGLMAVLQAEHEASGHSDYQHRLAWSCREMAAGQRVAGAQ